MGRVFNRWLLGAAFHRLFLLRDHQTALLYGKAGRGRNTSFSEQCARREYRALPAIVVFGSSQSPLLFGMIERKPWYWIAILVTHSNSS